ncbi:MAG: hypothetical protein WDN28_27290 [Chthoniobacter sp.]
MSLASNAATEAPPQIAGERSRLLGASAPPLRKIIEDYGATVLYTAPTANRAFIKWGDEWPKSVRQATRVGYEFRSD